MTIVLPKKKTILELKENDGTLTFPDDDIKFVGKFKDNHPFKGKWFNIKSGKEVFENSEYEYKIYPYGRIYKNGYLCYQGIIPYGKLYKGGSSFLGMYLNEGCFINNKIYHGNGNLYYEGGIKNKRRHGFGVIYYECGMVYYVGWFKNGVREGEGRTYSIIGKISYKGYFKDNLKECKGIAYDYEGRLHYEGYFKNHKYNGEGKYYNFGKLSQEGVFKNGSLIGKGKKYYGTGELKYEGEFKDGWIVGLGKKYYKNGNLQYEGSFYRDDFEGKGKKYYETGELMYEGEFRDNYFNGTGKSYHKNGKLDFVGKFENGMSVRKEGIQYYPEENICYEYDKVWKQFYKSCKLKYMGDIKHDIYNNYKFEYHGNGKLYFENGKIKYAGKFKQNQYYGYGKLYFEKGNILIGHFISNSLEDSMGTIVYPDGTFYQGECKLNKPNGFGILYTKTSKPIKIGHWCDDNFVIKFTPEDMETTYKNVNIYEGDRDEDYKYKGKGILYRLDKRPIKQGIWINNELQNGEVYEYKNTTYYINKVENFKKIIQTGNKKYYFNGNIVKYGHYIGSKFCGITILKFGDKNISANINGSSITDGKALECIFKEDFTKFKF